MSDSTVILNARLSQPTPETEQFQIVIERGRVKSVVPMNWDRAVSASASVLDVEGDWISAGAVDLQINGALGLAFPDLSAAHFELLQTICEWLWQQGIDGFCPTLVTTSPANFRESLAVIAAFQRQQKETENSSQIVGVHLEGPFLNPAKRGAHPADYLQPLTLASVKALIGDFAETVQIVTLAPEMEQSADGSVIEWLCEQGITVSLGHSLATAEQAKRAFDQGATMVTHAFNAMPALHHREPGLLGAAIADPRISCGFIADGQHICPAMLDLLLRTHRGGTSRQADGLLGGLFLVSDALSPLGLPDGFYPWDVRQIEVTGGTARLADGTLSGTTLPLIAGAINLVNWGLCSVDEAIALVSTNPRQAIGLTRDILGNSTQLMRWRQDANTQQLSWQRLDL
ncbi:MAG: N-acetylglucosamine-6-phosphate deacetylase [Phormidesmis sp.]